ncbi:MAG: hypothetical protein AB7O62_01050 [Pirellulales bacterium]
MRTLLLAALLSGLSVSAAAEEPLQVAFGECDITPDVAGRHAVWIAGYGTNRRAEGVHDPLRARAVVLQHGGQKIALVSVDLVGLQLPEVRAIRAKLEGFAYVMVSSTHNHEGPDVIGLWGPSPLASGVDRKYLRRVVDDVAQLVTETAARCQPATAEYGTAEDETLLGDSRLPKVYDGVLRVLKFSPVGGGRPLGILVQWNCHPESLGSKNKLITADFPWATVEAMKKEHSCPVAYFTGTVGGLMGSPDGVVKDAAGNLLDEGNFEYARVYGEMIAGLANKALASAQPLRLTPFAVFAKPVAVPLANPIYQAGRSLGVLQREARVWTGQAEELGEAVEGSLPAGATAAVETEVAYLRLGELHAACIPGEIYPELVYGKFQEPADPGADFPDAPLETPVMQSLPGPKTMLFGLANDEIGYIIPKRQWDQVPPFAYGRAKSQYGEINSVGPEAAPIVLQALADRVRDAAE